MATYHQLGRGGKRRNERTARDPMTDEALNKTAQLFADTTRKMEEDEKIRNELLEKLNQYLHPSTPEPDESEIPTTSTADTDMVTNNEGQHLEQTGESTTSNSESNTKNIAEPPTKKMKKKQKKQTKANSTDDNQLPTTNSCSSMPPDTATSLPISEINVDPPMGVSNEVMDPPTTSVKINTIKHIKVLIRGLTADFNTTDISQELGKAGFTTKKVIQFKKKVGEAYRLLPLFLTILIETELNHHIFSVTNIRDVPVKIERFRGGKAAIQCYNCQKYGHTQRICHSQPRCVKCSAEHRSFECQKDINTPPKCSNCGENHTANFTGCKVRPLRKGSRVNTSTTAGQAHRLVSIIKELQELLKNREVFQLLQTIMRESTPE